MEKVLTISIAAYNVSKFLEKTLDSLIIDDEHMEKMEVIIVNDGSKDDTSKKAHAYADKYPNTFKVIDKENGGYGSTVNASIKAATGKYYKLLDGDDWFDTDNLAGFIDYLEGCESDIVLTPFYEEYVSKNETKPVEHNSLIKENTVPVEKADTSDYWAMHEITVKSEILRNNNVRLLEHCFYTDMEFALNVEMYAKTISRLDKMIYHYRLGEDGQSVSKEGLKKHYKDAIKVSLSGCEKADKYFKENIDSDEVKDKIIQRRIKRMVSLAYTVILLLDDRKSIREEFREYDNSVKNNYPSIYRFTGEVKRIKMMRSTGFRFIRMYQKMV